MPQGSCLRPVLFSIYTNDLPEHLACNVVMYADDTQLLTCYRITDQDQAAEKLQSDLKAIEIWMELNHLKINAGKTQVITFDSHPQLRKIKTEMASSLCIGGATPNQLPFVTNLGVKMDAALSWQVHINQLCTKINAAMIQLAWAKHLIPRADLINATKSIRPFSLPKKSQL